MIDLLWNQLLEIVNFQIYLQLLQKLKLKKLKNRNYYTIIWISIDDKPTMLTSFTFDGPDYRKQFCFKNLNNQVKIIQNLQKCMRV